MKNKLKRWENETKELCDLFVLHYFDEDADVYWVADEIGGVLFVNDYFFNLSDIVDFIRHRYSKKKMFEYYDYALKCAVVDKRPTNIKSYRHLV